jgi:cell division septation protein DedD
MASGPISRLALLVAGALALGGCADGQLPTFLKGKSDGATAAATANADQRTVERDVEAPEVFQVDEKGLWDGRPSLGGVWVAHPDAKSPERVIIRNKSNGKFVVGVLYKPERQPVGPRIQVSSDAAQELGMLAGQPAELSVTALKHEKVPVASPDSSATGGETDTAAMADAGDAAAASVAATPAVTSQPLDPIAAAAAALDNAEGKPAPAAAPAPAPVSGLSKPFIQIGIFSVESNATNTAESLRQAGMVPTIKPGKMNGKNFWRVIVGPATSASERATLLKKIKGLGFTDAYFVTN